MDNGPKWRSLLLNICYWTGLTFRDILCVIIRGCTKEKGLTHMSRSPYCVPLQPVSSRSSPSPPPPSVFLSLLFLCTSCCYCCCLCCSGARERRFPLTTSSTTTATTTTPLHKEETKGLIACWTLPPSLHPCLHTRLKWWRWWWWWPRWEDPRPGLGLNSRTDLVKESGQRGRGGRDGGRWGLEWLRAEWRQVLRPRQEDFFFLPSSRWGKKSNEGMAHLRL